MQEAILKSNFLGRDGFRWWIGQVAPIEAQGDQVNGGGWGNRWKVRIMGYHPFDLTELPDVDLPWAQCLLPTTAGTGAAQMASNTKIRPGDVVLGFFLDSDNAQSPVIMGAFGRTDQVLTSPYSSPFIPFTGSTDNLPKPTNGKIAPNEQNQDNANSTKSPRRTDVNTASKLNNVSQTSQSSPNAEISYSNVIGQKTTFANTCQDNTINTITTLIQNLLKKFQAAGNILNNIKNDIDKVVSKINSLLNNIVGQMFNYLFNELIPILQAGLQLLYETVFATVFAAAGGPSNPFAAAIAHAAGVAEQVAMTGPVKILEDAISCAASKVVNGLGGIISDLLYSFLQQVENVIDCASNQFVASLFNNIISKIESELTSSLNGVTKILSGGFSVANVLLGAVSAIEGIGGLFDCNQSGHSKCSGLTKNWEYGTGGSDNTTNFDTILNNMNVASALGSLTNSSNFDIYQPSTKNPTAPVSPLGGCYTGPPTHCNTPTISIFGGQGSGATAIPIMGSIINYAAGSNETTNSITQTASIIGAVVTNGGSGYNFPPNVAFSDNCNQGYGAVGQAIINDAGEVTAITILSAGEFYPVDTPQSAPPYAVIDVIVENPGSGYSNGDMASDNLGNTYDLIISNGQITSVKPININIISDLPKITISSTTGIGAILRPIIGVAPNPFPGTQGKVIDSNQCYIQ